MFTVSTFRQWDGAASAVLLFSTPIARAQVCPFDSGGASLQNDDLVLTRYALGVRGAPMVANTSFAAADAPTIESNINCPSCGLRVTNDKDALNNPIFTVADATIISRKLAGFQGASLTNGLALGVGTRNTAAAVQSFLLSGCGATGGTVTSVTAGTGLTGGTVTTAGTIAADTTCLQRRISTACGTGSFVTGIAADGTPSCAAPAASGTGTVTSVGAGYGLVANGSNVVGNAVVSSGLIELANGYILPQGCAMGQVPKSGGGGSWVCAADNAGGGVTNAFVNSGNAFGAPGVLGTTDGQPLTVGTGSGNGLRVIPSFVNSAPNIILGSGLNSIVNSSSVVGTTVGGGQLNAANGAFATISGGQQNTAAGNWATVAGGSNNAAGGAYSFAAGQRAKAAGQGSFVWADSTPLDYNAGVANGPSNPNSFNVPATGGVNIVTAVDASGVATKGLSVDSTGNTRTESLQVTGASETGSLRVGVAGTVINGIQAGRAAVDAPGVTALENSALSTCDASAGFLVCHVEGVVIFPVSFSAGSTPLVQVTIYYGNPN